LFPDTNWAAVSSNVIWDIGTTAVISAVSSPGTCNGGRVKTAYYITTSYASLETETSVGEGTHLNALADLMKCKTDARPALFVRVRSEMAKEMAAPGFATQDRVKKSEAYFNVVDRLTRNEFESACDLT
jgi:hypothetical protein